VYIHIKIKIIITIIIVIMVVIISRDHCKKATQFKTAMAILQQVKQQKSKSDNRHT